MGEEFRKTELDWKNHNLFFQHLNDKLLEISEIAEKSLINTELLNLYYSKVNIAFNRYSVYFNDDQNVNKHEKTLEKIQQVLYSGSYLNSLENYNKLVDTKKIELGDLQRSIYNRLNKIYKYMITKLVEYDLLPKVYHKPIRDSELETDPEKKLELEAIERLELQ